MDLYEKINSLEFSLRTICGVCIVQRVVEAVGIPPREPFREDAERPCRPTNGLPYRKKAKRRLRLLKLPQQVQSTLVGLVKPVYIELELWYNRYQFRARPVWTPHGTVDWAQSTKAIVEDVGLPNLYRYQVACAFCHERLVFEIAPLLTPAELHNICTWQHNVRDTSNLVQSEPLRAYDLALCFYRRPSRFYQIAKFWTNIYVNQMDDPGNGFHIPQDFMERVDGFQAAIFSYVEVGIRFFIERNLVDEIELLVGGLTLYNSLSGEMGTDFSPATSCLLFSKIRDPEERQSLYKGFALSMLKRLLEWPYQPIYLDVAASLSNVVDKKIIYRTLSFIAKKFAGGYSDYNYRELFIKLWEMYVHRWSKTRSDGRRRMKVVHHVLLTKDEQWIAFIFSKFTAEEIEQLLCYGRQCDGICFTLVTDFKYNHLETLFRYCGAEDVSVLLRFRCSLNDTSVLRDHYYDCKNYESQRILEILEKVIVEHPSASVR